MSNFSEALVFAASYCSISEHCESEVLSKISRFGLAPEDQKNLIQRLKKENFINEKRFVKAFVNDKFRINKWGRIKIRFLLKQKGIQTEIIDEGLAQIPEPEYHDMIFKLLKEKRPAIKSKNAYELRSKMIRFASGKGFELSAITYCLKELDIADE
jgi:regulatory protein